MLHSPVEFRYDDGIGSVVLIKTGGTDSGGTAGAPAADGAGGVKGGEGRTGSAINPLPLKDSECPGGSPGGANANQIIIQGYMGDSPIRSSHAHHHPGPGGSITILTPSRVKICINNRYGGREMPPLKGTEYKTGLTKKEDSWSSSECGCRCSPELAPDVPDARFRLADDVLVRMDGDEQLYLGTIVEVGVGRCLVRFDDQTNRWAAFGDITKFGDTMQDNEEEQEDDDDDDDENEDREGTENGDNVREPICTVCEQTRPDEVIERCERCDRAYHTRCEMGNVGDNGNRNGGPPLANVCRQCAAPPKPEENGDVCRGSIPDEFSPLTSVAQLPYEPAGLEWNATHRVNTTGQYCYCGADGDWVKEMIQCRRCRQWFHGRCVRSLQYPIFLGDTFYLFLCSICNHGHEFVRRLELSWTNLAHLALYNLIMRNGPRFYDLRSAIVAYIEDNVRTLQLPDQITTISTNARADHVQQALRAGGGQFLNGKDMYRPGQMWTLHAHNPPPLEPHVIPVPDDQTVTESLLQQKVTAGACTFRFLPRAYLGRSYVADAVTRERMIGIKYAGAPESLDDPRSSKSLLVPVVVLNPLPATTSQREPAVLKRRGRRQNVAALQHSDKPFTVPSGRDTINRRDGPPVPMNKRKHRTRRTLPPLTLGVYPGLEAYASSDDSSARTTSTLDYIIPLPKDFHGPNNPFYNQLTSHGTVGHGMKAGVGRPRKTPIVKRRLNAHDFDNVPQLKRRRLSQAGSASHQSHVTAPMVIPPSIAPSKAGSLLSWRNLQRHNIEHHDDGATQPPTCSSSTASEQAAAGMKVPGQVTAGPGTDGSTANGSTRPGRASATSSGRLRPRAYKNYSDTKRHPRRTVGTKAQSVARIGKEHGPDGVTRRKRSRRDEDDLSSCGPASSGVVFDDYSSSVAQYSGSEALSSRRSTYSGGCSMAPWPSADEPADEAEAAPTVATKPNEANGNRRRFVVLGKRTSAAGKEEFLFEAR